MNDAGPRYGYSFVMKNRLFIRKFLMLGGEILNLCLDMLRVFCARGRNIFIMKLITNVEYFTRWGEELFLRAFGRLYGMEYAGDGKWRAVIGKLEPGRTFEYRYELHSGGLCRRTEWEPHVVTMPEKNSRKPLEIRDSWNDVPDGLPFRSAPFAEGVFDRRGDGLWKAAGTA